MWYLKVNDVVINSSNCYQAIISKFEYLMFEHTLLFFYHMANNSALTINGGYDKSNTCIETKVGHIL